MATDMNTIVDKFKALSIGEKVILVAAVLLFIIGFLPWYHVGGGTVDVGGITVANVPSVDRSGWQSPGQFWSILAILLGLAMAAVIVVKTLAKEGTLPPNVGGVSWPKIHLGAGVAALLFVLIKLLNESSYLGFGFYVGIIATAALAAGGFLLFREEMAAGGGAGSSAGSGTS